MGRGTGNAFNSKDKFKDTLSEQRGRNITPHTEAAGGEHGQRLTRDSEGGCARHVGFTHGDGTMSAAHLQASPSEDDARISVIYESHASSQRAASETRGTTRPEEQSGKARDSAPRPPPGQTGRRVSCV